MATQETTTTIPILERVGVLILFLLVASSWIVLVEGASSSSSSFAKEVLGVPPSDLGLYSSPEFQCRDGSIKLAASQINDDYCDCPDGSDEPGTPACSPQGRFYCRNRGYRGEYIPSSHVRDGVCDCCDGSDEVAGTCDNFCLTKGKQYREEKRVEIDLHMKGAEKRYQHVLEARDILKERAAKREPLQAQIEALRAKSTELNAAKTAKESEKKLADELIRKTLQNEEAKKAEEEAKKKSEEETSVTETESEEHQEEASSQEPEDEEEFDTYEDLPDDDDDDDDDDTEGHNDDDGERPSRSNEEKFTEEELEAFKKTLAEAGKTPEEVVQEFDQLSDEIREVREEIRPLEKELNELKEDDDQDFGKDLEFFYLKSQCFESKSVEYTYKVCPFDSAKQDSTNLGRFHAITKDEEKGHFIMEFTEGTKCWGGPARSMSIRFVCGLEEHLKDVEEPSRCAYSATLTTPAVCSKEYGLQLRQALQEDGVLLDDDVIPFV